MTFLQSVSKSVCKWVIFVKNLYARQGDRVEFLPTPLLIRNANKPDIIV